MKSEKVHPSTDQIETHLKTLAQNFAYPSTPNLAAELKLRQPSIKPTQPSVHRLFWAATVAVVIALVILSLSPARTIMLEFLQTGPIRIFLMEPYQATLTPTATATHTASAGRPVLPQAPILAASPTLAATPVVVVSNVTPAQFNGLAESYAIEPVFFNPDPVNLSVSDGANR